MGNRKRDTALRCTEHQLGECNVFMGNCQAVGFLGNRQAVTSAKPGTRAVSVLFLQCAASFQLPGES
jgi:hypothetical protein